MFITLDDQESKQLHELFQQKMIEALADSAENVLKLYTELPLLATRKEVRKCLGVSDATLNYWIREGLKVTRITPKSYRIAKEDLIEFLKKNKY